MPRLRTFSPDDNRRATNILGLFRDGLPISTVSKITGLSEARVARFFPAHEDLWCPCGQHLKHRGACQFRRDNSAERLLREIADARRFVIRPYRAPKAIRSWQERHVADHERRRLLGEKVRAQAAARIAAKEEQARVRAATAAQRAAQRAAKRARRADGSAPRAKVSTYRTKALSTYARFDGRLPPIPVVPVPDIEKIIFAAVRARTSMYGDNRNEVIQETWLAFMEGRVALEDIDAIVRLQHHRQLRAAGKFGEVGGNIFSIDDVFEDGSPRIARTI